MEFVASADQDIADLASGYGTADGSRVHSEQPGGFGDGDSDSVVLFGNWHALNLPVYALFVNNSVDKRTNKRSTKAFSTFLPLIFRHFKGNLLTLLISVDTH